MDVIYFEIGDKNIVSIIIIIIFFFFFCMPKQTGRFSYYLALDNYFWLYIRSDGIWITHQTLQKDPRLDESFEYFIEF
jgi:hypothetical protein